MCQVVCFNDLVVTSCDLLVKRYYLVVTRCDRDTRLVVMRNDLIVTRYDLVVTRYDLVVTRYDVHLVTTR